MKKDVLDELLAVMACLRDPDKGCPWDLKQDFRSIAPATLEEAYELVDAIEQGDMSQVREELGDVLFQVIFYSQLANEQELFNFKDVVSVLTKKLLRRHPHVFPDATLASFGSAPSSLNEQQVVASWDAIKQQERKTKKQSGLLADVPKALPAMDRARKLQKRAAEVNFDWTALHDVISKLKEETQELEQAIAEKSEQSIQEEFGDLLFSCVNLGRHLKVNPELALRACNNKFEARLTWMENRLADENRTFTDCTSEQLESYWRQAKKSLSGQLETSS